MLSVTKSAKGHQPRRIQSLENSEVLMPLSSKDEIAWYLSIGEHDGLYAAWPGESLIACARNGELALRRALISAVNDRAPTAKVPDALADLDVAALPGQSYCQWCEHIFRPLSRRRCSRCSAVRSFS